MLSGKWWHHKDLPKVDTMDVTVGDLGGWQLGKNRDKEGSTVLLF